MEVVVCTHQTYKAIAMIMAYSLYLQCSKGTVDPKWKVTPVSGPRIWQRMSLQMVQYKSSNLQYPGGEKMRKNTQMNKKRRGTSDIGLMECDNHIKRVSYLLYLDENKPQGPCGFSSSWLLCSLSSCR
jgi:hypothetical protein